MKITHFTFTSIALAVLPLITMACGTTDQNAEETVAPPAEEPPTAQAAPHVEQSPNPLDYGAQGTEEELLAALARGELVYVVLHVGTKLGDGSAIALQDQNVARAVRALPDRKLEVEINRPSGDVLTSVGISEVKYLKTLDHTRVAGDVERATTTAIAEIDDFDLDEAMRRTTLMTHPINPINPVPPVAPPKDFDCIARFALITASRDFVPFPLTNCSAPQDPVGDPERIADAQQAKRVAQNLFNQALTAYQNAQAMIAALQARAVAIQNAYVFIHHDPAFKEYNVLHFKRFISGKKSYNDRFERAEAMLRVAAAITQQQIAMYAQVPPPSVTESRAEANRIVARKWNCVLKRGLLENGGRSGSAVVGTTIESVGAPFVDVQVMLDDHPPLPTKDGWGGVFGTTPHPGAPTDITRLAVSEFVPVRATVGLPIVMFRFQPLDAKKARPVGQACNLRAAIVP